MISQKLKYFIYRLRLLVFSYLLVFVSALNVETQAQCPADVLQGQNLVQNGDFSGGTSNWTFTEDSDGDPSSVDGYILFNPPVTQNFSQPGFINIGDDPTFFNAAFGNFGDHTDGAGNMMMVDGICTVGAKLWTQSGISVSPNTTYYFSVWVHALQDGNDPPGTLQFEIEAGGTTYNPTPSAITAPVNLADGWVQFEATWVSPAGLAPGTLANISIENTTTTGCGTDVDFALDDISFIPGCTYADATTTISPDLGVDQTICGKGGGAIVLDVTDEGINDVATNEIWWSDGIGDGTGGAGSGQFTRSITPDPADLPLTISVCTKVSGGCTKTDVITISGDYQITVPDVNLCDPASVTLDAGFTGVDVTYQWSKEQNGTAGWQTDDEVNGAGSQTFFVNEPGTYKVQVNDPACGIREDEIMVTTSAPEPINDTFCLPQNVTLYVTPNNDGKYKWWDDPVSEDPSNLVQKGGASYTFSATNTSDYIFYVDDTATFASNIAPEYNTGTFTSPENAGNIGVTFQAFSPFSITEVTVVPYVYDVNTPITVSFELYDIDNAQVVGNYSTVSMTPNALQNGAPFNDSYTVAFSTPVEIPAAGNYRLVPTSGSQMPFFNGATWSGYSMPGVIELTGNTSSDGAKVNYFPGFFNWKISAGTQCARVPVIATYYCPPCSQPTAIDFIPDADTLRLCPDKDISIAASFAAPDTSMYGGFYYTWYKDGSIFSAASTGVTPPSLDLTALSATDAATYTLRVEDGNIEDPGCFLERDIVVEVPLTLPGSIGTDHAICLGEEASALTSVSDASGGYGTIEYQWQYNDGLNWVDLAGATGVNYSPGAITSTTEYRRAAFWGTCDSVYTTSVTVTVNPVPVVSANNDTTICAGQSVNLQASGADTFLWDNGLGAGASHTVTPAGTTTYTVIGSFATGCEDTTEVVVTVNPLPTATISGGGDLCNGENATISFVLTGTAPYTLNYTDAGGVAQSPTPAAGSYSITTTVVGTYTLTGIEDANGCTNAATGSAVVDTIPDLLYTSQLATCDFVNAEFTVSFDVGGGDGTYTITGENGGSLTGNTYTSNPISGAGATAYSFALSDGSGCPENTNVIVSGNQNCSCPVVGTLDSSPQEICVDQTSVDFVVNLTGAVSTPYAIEITAPDGTILPFNNLIDGDNTITINNLQSGTYSLTKASDASCTGSSSGSVVLTVNPLPTASISGSATICNDAITTAPVEILVSGGLAPYNVVYSVDGGAGQILTINTVPFTYSTNDFGNHELVSVSDARGCSSLASGLTGIAVISGDELPTISNAGSPGNICTGEYQLSGNTPLVGSGIWTDDKGLVYDDPTSPTATANGIGSGETVTFTWTISNGVCPASSSTLAITRIGSLTPPDLGNDTTICSSSPTLTLVANVSGGTWTTDGAATISQNLASAVVSNLDLGPNHFVYTIDDGFCPPMSDDIVVLVDEEVEQPVVTPNNIRTCSNSYVLPAPSPQVLPGVGNWSILQGQGTLVQPSDPETTINGLTSPGVTRLLWTVQNGVCPSKADTLDIEIPEPVGDPQIFIDGGSYSMENITNAEADLCRNTSYNLFTSTPGQGELLLWSKVSGNSVQKPSGSSTAIVMNSSGTSVFSLTVTNNTTGCPAKNAQVNLNVINPPAQPGIISGPNSAICAGTGDLEYSINSLPGANSYSWKIISGTGLSLHAPDSGAGVTGIKLDVAGNATSGTLKVTAWNNCGSSPARTIGVSVSPLVTPMANISGKDTICEGEEVEFLSDLSAETTGPQFSWYHNGTLVSPGGTSSKLLLDNIADKDSVRLEVRSNYACTTKNPVSSNTIYMTVKPLVEVDVDIEADQEFPVCEGEQVTFTALPVNPGSAPVFSWTASNGMPASGNGSVFTTTINASSLITVRMISDEACLSGNNTAISLEDVKAIQNEAVTTTILSPDPTCEGENVSSPFVALSNGVGVDASYQWTLDGQDVGNGEGFYVPPVELAPGSYSIGVTVITDLECVLNTTDNDVTTHLVNPRPQVDIDGPQIICPEGTVTLTGTPATGNYSYKWLNGLLEIPGENSSILEVSQSGGYFLEVTDNVNQCKSRTIQEYSVTSISQEPLEISGDPDLVKCEGESIELTVTPPGNIMLWKKDDDFIGQAGQTVMVDEAGIYKVIWTYIGGSQQCTDSVEAELIEFVPPKPVINESSGLMCSGEEYLLTATPESGGEIRWLRNGLTIPGAIGDEFAVTKGGQYTAVEENDVCAGLSDPVDVTIEATPVANAGQDQFVPAKQPVLLSASGSINAFGYQWSSLNYSGDFRNINETDILVLPELNKTYFVITAYSTSGQCFDSDTVLVTTELGIKPWNSFSPNSDGVYDTWIVENLSDYPNAEIEIYNRWGNLVWRSKGYNKPWKGENFRNGQLLPVATYYYVIYPNGGYIKEPITGPVTIVK